MNFTSSLAAQESPKIQRNAESQPLGVVGEAPRPTWSITARWAWACGLPVSGIARAVANCIARHANDKTGLGWPGMALIVKETGFKRTAVIAGIKALERGGHINEDLRQYFSVQDRPGCMWKFTIPAPLMAVVEPRPIGRTPRPNWPTYLVRYPVSTYPPRKRLNSRSILSP